LHNGELDIALGGLSHTFDRVKYVYFSDTYVHLQQALILNRREAARLHIEDNPYRYLQAHPAAIGVLTDSSYVEFARILFPQAEVREYGAWQDALLALSRREVQAVLDDNNTVALLARKHPEIALDVTVYILKNMRDNVAIALSPVNPNLRDCLNLYLESHELYLDLNALMARYPEVYRCE